MIEVVNVSSKGQIVIPEKVRERFGINPGTKLVLIEKTDMLLLKKEEEVARQIEKDEQKETIGWMMLSEKSLKDIWDNPKDAKIWKKYL